MLYYPKYGIPSALSEKATHNYHPVEQDANGRAYEYFRKHAAGFTWDFIENPIVDFNYRLGL